ncbi:MAG TPA: DegT/DnrJ/EryC1/StrS family aminotransferase [Anaeromyxobacteraceae bacterium]|nr:DegT/DnrJ/EryC1/StrS family aminotransferase [Anaeromyxobacteraceae bacterium]
MLRPNRGMPEAPFPFSAPAARRYYFARNAVFHGMRLLGLDGTEALVPAYHHGVEVEALVAAGVTPRFVRVDARMRLDLEALEAAIGPRTRSIYVIHYAGFPQPMTELAAIARRRGLSLVEDCALSLLSRDGDVPLGSSGELGIFCLYKTVPVPNGGLLVRNDGAAVLPPPPKPAPLVSSVHHAGGSLLANAAFRAGETGQAVRQLVREGVRAVRHASHVRHVSTGTMHFDRADVDLGMSGLSELVLGNLDFDQIVAARRRNYFLLLGRLRELAPPIFSELPAGVCPLFYPLLCDDKRAVKERLAARGVETVDFWSTGHPGCDLASFPEVAALRRRVLELPNHQDLEPEDMAYIARAVEECL